MITFVKEYRKKLFLFDYMNSYELIDLRQVPTKTSQIPSNRVHRDHFIPGEQIQRDNRVTLKGS